MPKKQAVSKQTPSITNEQLAELRALLPHVFSEGKIDFEKLHAALGDFGDERPERYSFTWAGKREAIRILQTPSRATLVPARKESVDFDKTQNIFIEGDNLEALKLLYKAYFGQVKMIYIDPPYNTGNDFVYPDNFADPLDTYLKLTKQKDGEGNLLTSNAETGGRYHSAWLSMMYPRLFLARQLLREDGVIFVSIDDHEVHNLRLVMNEIFGEENFITSVIWQKKYTRSNDAKWFSDNHDFILVYAKSAVSFELNLQPRTEEQKGAYSNPDNHPKGDWKATPIHAKSGNTQGFKFTFKNGVTWSPPTGTYPRYSVETLLRLDEGNELWFGKDGKSIPSRKSFLAEVKEGLTPITIWEYEEVGHTHEANNELKNLGLAGVFDNPKPSRLLRRMIELSASKLGEDIILDFFSGSATTAQAIFELNREDGGNRRFILVQLPEPTGNKEFRTIAEIGKERIRRVIKKMKKEREGQFKLDKPEDLGFKVFKLRESNYKQWSFDSIDDPKAYIKQLEMFADPLIEDWLDENVIYEVSLKEGYGLNTVMENSAVKGVQKVSDPDKEQSFYICLADQIRLKDLRPLDLKKNDLFICRDIALDDEAAANLSLQCRLKTI